MSRTTSPAATPTFTAQLQHALSCFDGASGYLQIRSRSLEGFAQQDLTIALPLAPGLPAALLRMIGPDAMTARITPFIVDSAGAPRALLLLSAMWRPTVDFPVRSHVVTAEGQAVVRAALARMPPPSVFVDGGPEVWGAWRFATPITDVGFARTLLHRAAVALGGEDFIHEIRNEGADAHDLPLAGMVRNWNAASPEPITIEVADPARRYTLSELEACLKETVHAISTSSNDRATDSRRARRPRAAE